MIINIKYNEVIVKKLPKCNFCESDARYDAKTLMNGSWANMCFKHWKLFAACKTLGLGKGQNLILEHEV